MFNFEKMLNKLFFVFLVLIAASSPSKDAKKNKVDNIVTPTLVEKMQLYQKMAGSVKGAGAKKKKKDNVVPPTLVNSQWNMKFGHCHVGYAHHFFFSLCPQEQEWKNIVEPLECKELASKTIAYIYKRFVTGCIKNENLHINENAFVHDDRSGVTAVSPSFSPSKIRKVNSKSNLNKPREYDSDGYIKRVATVCIKTKQKKTLVILVSSKNKENWIIPGGGIEPKEDSRTTAIRELSEEAGVKGDIVQCLGIFENHTTMTRTKVYLAKYTDDTKKIEDKNHEWLALQNAIEVIDKYKPEQGDYLRALQLYLKIKNLKFTSVPKEVEINNN